VKNLRRLFFIPLLLAFTLGVTTPALAEVGRTAPRAAQTAPNRDTTYVVQAGDSLYRIATKFNVTVEAIVAANHLTGTVIRPGQALIIPGVGSDPAQPSSTGPTGDITYVVRSGDSLYRLAAKFKVTVDVLIAVNHLTNTSLRIGQTLTIPGTAQTSPSGDPNSVYGRIQGSESFVQRVKEALDWLQANDAEAYNRVNTYVTVITPSPFANLATAAPLRSGGCAVRALARDNLPIEMVVALLYHEASHCYQFATAGVLSSKEAEVFAYSEQIAFMERHGYPKEVIEAYRQILAYYASQPDDGRFIPPPDV